ncbi:hypothetical protein AYJ57_21365 (plasmid) [Salipiger sp. CCB-MM3]|uniref:hypothetical protein n=1 Tax=Salipiger sp. CCB-MM3 TaxID=1792508 RepID=UPI00080A9BFF|nr:hypothetical protein [Salipiger sp. CCB-MM3]ANT63026.1 hypothetical protein AYJ57_21365 [Salipiger sp. CCB-MM3]
MSEKYVSAVSSSWWENKLHKSPISVFITTSMLAALFGLAVLVLLFWLFPLFASWGWYDGTSVSERLERMTALAGATLGISVSLAGALTAVVLARRAVTHSDDTKEVAARQLRVDETALFRDFVLESGVIENAIDDSRRALKQIELIYDAAINLQKVDLEYEIRMNKAIADAHWDIEFGDTSKRDSVDENSIKEPLEKERQSIIDSEQEKIESAIIDLTYVIKNLQYGRTEICSIFSPDDIKDIGTVYVNSPFVEWDIDIPQYSLEDLDPDESKEHWVRVEALLDLLTTKMWFVSTVPFASEGDGPAWSDVAKLHAAYQAYHRPPHEYFPGRNALPLGHIQLDNNKWLRADFGGALMTAVLRATAPNIIRDYVLKTADEIEGTKPYRRIIEEALNAKIATLQKEFPKASILYERVEATKATPTFIYREAHDYMKDNRFVQVPEIVVPLSDYLDDPEIY